MRPMEQAKPPPRRKCSRGGPPPRRPGNRASVPAGPPDAALRSRARGPALREVSVPCRILLTGLQCARVIGKKGVLIKDTGGRGPYVILLHV